MSQAGHDMVTMAQASLDCLTLRVRLRGYQTAKGASSQSPLLTSILLEDLQNEEEQR